MDEILNRNRNINRGFRKLNIWKDSIDEYVLIHKVLDKNSSVPFKVKAQLEDSALSISSNIAEGYARRSIRETLRFYEISLSSAAENYSQAFALFAAAQIKKTEFDEIDLKLYEVENKLIRMNKSLISQINQGTEWKVDY